MRATSVRESFCAGAAGKQLSRGDWACFLFTGQRDGAPHLWWELGQICDIRAIDNKKRRTRSIDVSLHELERWEFLAFWVVESDEANVFHHNNEFTGHQYYGCICLLMAIGDAL